MKKLIFILLVGLTCYLAGLCGGQLINLPFQSNTNQPVFIWNDDKESIPVDSTPIMLQYTSNDTIYLGILETETNSPEYQFTITDDSISIHDFDRYVGTVKIEGQLKQLIDQDNE